MGGKKPGVAVVLVFLGLVIGMVLGQVFGGKVPLLNQIKRF